MALSGCDSWMNEYPIPRDFAVKFTQRGLVRTVNGIEFFPVSQILVGYLRVDKFVFSEG